MLRVYCTCYAACVLYMLYCMSIVHAMLCIHCIYYAACVLYMLCCVCIVYAILRVYCICYTVYIACVACSIYWIVCAIPTPNKPPSLYTYRIAP